MEREIRHLRNRIVRRTSQTRAGLNAKRMFDLLQDYAEELLPSSESETANTIRAMLSEISACNEVGAIRARTFIVIALWERLQAIGLRSGAVVPTSKEDRRDVVVDPKVDLSVDVVRRCAGRILDTWSLFLPVRLVNEEIGDYLEDINRRLVHGKTWCIYLRVASAIFWTGLNAIGYARTVLGKKRAG